MHIHVQSAGGEAKLWIEPAIELARNYQFSEQDSSRALQLVIEHEQEIRDAWPDHGPPAIRLAPPGDLRRQTGMGGDACATLLTSHVESSVRRRRRTSRTVPPRSRAPVPRSVH